MFMLDHLNTFTIINQIVLFRHNNVSDKGQTFTPDMEQIIYQSKSQKYVSLNSYYLIWSREFRLIENLLEKDERNMDSILLSLSLSLSLEMLWQ